VLTALADGGVGASVGLEVATVVDASGAQLARVADAAGPGWPRLDLVEGDEEGVDLGEGRFDGEEKKEERGVISLDAPLPRPLTPPPPFSVSVAISALALHWVNDLPGLLTRVRRSLAPDGLFVASLWGGDATLRELRSAFAAAEMAVAGGLSPRVAPTVRAADAGGLLTRAGLALPGVDVDQLVVRYAGGPRAAVAHLRAMADSNAVVRRAPFLPRAVAAAAMEGYAKEYGDADGSVPATFEVVFLTGWALPEKGGGPVPAARGSGTVSLRDLEAALREKKE
jgi:NADH dehydrogenase [ubiquinone] 1 alpha subcomplex assembly factor 5